jgi:hypothetical protein
MSKFSRGVFPIQLSTDSLGNTVALPPLIMRPPPRSKAFLKVTAAELATLISFGLCMIDGKVQGNEWKTFCSEEAWIDC